MNYKASMSDHAPLKILDNYNATTEQLVTGLVRGKFMHMSGLSYAMVCVQVHLATDSQLQVVRFSTSLGSVRTSRSACQPR